MNKTYLCVLPLALFLAGSPGYVGAQAADCANKGPDKMPKCEAAKDPQAPVVTLNLNSMKATPHCIHVDEGTPIVFRLTPKKDRQPDTVEIVPKSNFDSWLQGKNDVFKDFIIIIVPEDDKLGVPNAEKRETTHHDYSIYLPNGECLDPRVEVEH